MIQVTGMQLARRSRRRRRIRLVNGYDCGFVVCWREKSTATNLIGREVRVRFCKLLPEVATRRDEATWHSVRVRSTGDLTPRSCDCAVRCSGIYLMVACMSFSG